MMTTTMTMRSLLFGLVLLVCTTPCNALSVSRRQWLLAQGAASAVAASGGATTAFVSSAPSPAVAATITDTTTKLTNLSNDELQKILQQDVDVNQFLVTGKISRQVYDESCTFTDEIDTYGMDQWIVGTARLFVGDKSSLRLTSPITVTNNEASFEFDEDLMFNLPIVKPVVHLTGKLSLKRDPTTGLITSYKETWDQGVWDVLKTAKI